LGKVDSLISYLRVQDPQANHFQDPRKVRGTSECQEETRRGVECQA
jgi:hypothetical protein